MSRPIIQSYVWHGEKCFFVSTIDRESSAMEGGTYAETMVWEFDFKERNRGDIVGQGEDATGSAREHYALCQRLIDSGSMELPDDGDAL